MIQNEENLMQKLNLKLSRQNLTEQKDQIACTCTYLFINKNTSLEFRKFFG